MLSETEELDVLAIGAHPDDIELGAAGVVYRLIRERAARIRFLILSAGLQHWSTGQTFERGTRVGEAIEAARTLGVSASDVEILEFPDCQLHLHLHDLIEQIEQRLYVNGRAANNVVLTHTAHDTHSDHRQAYEATIAAARAYSGTILLYQAVSTIPNMFDPTYFVSLTEEAIDAKQRALECHESQRAKDFMKRVRTEGMARGWALFLRRPGAFLEAFEVHKAFWNHVERDSASVREPT